MARPRGFDTETLLQQAGELFIRRGFNATSIDEIVHATGVVRGSLYSIFGSKQGIFVAALKLAAGQWEESDTSRSRTGQARGEGGSETLVNLVNVALFDIAPHNREVADLVQRIISTNGITARALGQCALDRVRLHEAARQP